MKKLIIFAAAIFAACGSAMCCTSAIVRADATSAGRPLLWKHRDTGTEHNFVAKVEREGRIPYVALFNGGDSLLVEAWMGLNEAGFGIMNTASYNLAPDTATIKDREGIVMSLALAHCRSLADFETLLDTLPKPLGVQANFGVIDAHGGGAYYETDDRGYVKYSIDDAPDGVLVRTNFSCSGDKDCGMGYIRDGNARYLLAPHIAARDISPATFTEGLSRSFYHSLMERDALDGDERWAVDQDFIPRYSSSASIVIEGVASGGDPSQSVMWTAIGYPPCAAVQPVTVDSVPERLQPVAPGWRSPECNYVLELKRQVFPITRGSGRHYIDLDALRPILARRRSQSLSTYRHRYF